MKMLLKCEKPEDVVYTMSVTMTAAEWERVRDQMDESGSAWRSPLRDLRSKIDDLLGQARKIYWAKEE